MNFTHILQDYFAGTSGTAVMHQAIDMNVEEYEIQIDINIEIRIK